MVRFGYMNISRYSDGTTDLVGANEMANHEEVYYGYVLSSNTQAALIFTGEEGDLILLIFSSPSMELCKLSEIDGKARCLRESHSLCLSQCMKTMPDGLDLCLPQCLGYHGGFPKFSDFTI